MPYTASDAALRIVRSSEMRFLCRTIAYTPFNLLTLFNGKQVARYFFSTYHDKSFTVSGLTATHV